jgi:hypothetical protein
MKTCEEVQKLVKDRKYKVDELTGQREHNASEGNWTIVKAIKEQIANHQRAINILNEVLEADAI